MSKSNLLRPSLRAQALAWLGILICGASIAQAATTTITIGFDTDNNPATGCTLVVGGQSLPGIEVALDTLVTTTATTGTVGVVSRRSCAGTTFGAPVVLSAGGWPVGMTTGSGGSDLIESFVPLADLPGATLVKIAAITGSDSVVATQLLDLRAGPPPPPPNSAPIPTLSPLALLALMVLVAVTAWMLKRYAQAGGSALFVLCIVAVSLTTLSAWAIVLDGNGADWSGISPLGTDASGDAAAGDDLAAIFAVKDGANVSLRVDAFLARDVGANKPPVVTAGAAQTIALGGQTGTVVATLVGSASDDGLPAPPGALTYAWTLVSGPNPGTQVQFANAASASTTVTLSEAGTFVLRLTASDGAASAGSNVQITVQGAPNAAPALAFIPDFTIPLGTPFTLRLAANDVNFKDALTFSLAAGPFGATMAPPGSGVVNWSPTQSAQLGTHLFTVRVQDKAGISDQKDFHVTVTPANRPPVWNALPDLTKAVGAGIAVSLAATDPDAGDTLSYTLLSGPGGMSLGGPGNATLGWTPTLAQLGKNTIKVRVSDSGSPPLSAVAMFTIDVTPNSPPLAKDDNYKVQVGKVLVVPAAGVLTNDVDADGQALAATKLGNPAIGSLTAFNSDGGFTYQAPATVPGDPLTVAKQWSAGAGSDRYHELVADLNGDGFPDIVSFDNNAGIRARSGQNGSQLWSADRTGADDCQLNSGAGSMDSRVLADIDDSGHPALAYTTFCNREGSSWQDSIVAFDHLGHVKWVSPPLSKPHPDIVRGATPPPPGGFTPGGVAYGSGLSVARMTANGPPVLLMRTEIPVNWGFSTYYDAAGAFHYVGCRAVTGLPADENVACRATLIISGTDGRVLQTLVARNPAALPRTSGPNSLSQLPPIAMDIDGDGRVDLVSGTEVWMQNAGGGFDLAWQLTTSVNDTAVADLDGDGKAEIIHMRSNNEYIEENRGIFIYSFDGQLKRRIPFQGFWMTPLTIADVDGDGRSDIVVGADGTIYAFRDDGQPIWAYVVPQDTPDNPVFAPFYVQPTQSSAVANAAPQVYDLDGDGVPEVVFAAYSRIVILDGRTGKRKVNPYWTYNFSYHDISALMLLDVNNDGHVDIVQNSSFLFNCLFVGADFLTECINLIGPTALSGGGSNNWLPGPKAFPHVQYRSTAIDNNSRVLHDTKVSRVFRTPEQQGTVRDPRLAQAASFNYAAGDGATNSPATVFIDILPDNQPPVFTSTPPKSVWQHSDPNPPYALVTHFYDVAAYDPDPGDTLTFSLKSAPSWVTLSGPSRIRFEPTCGSYGYPCPWGQTMVVVTATDSRGASSDQIFIVNLTTSSVTVPNVVGVSLATAQTTLIAQDLQGVLASEIFAAQPAGTVLAQDAVAGAVVGRFDDIRLTVSKGPTPVTVPFVVGRTESAATTALSGVGFSVVVARQFSSVVPRGTVISQVPAGNTLQPPDTAQIVVSSGNGLALTLSSGLMPANQTLTARPVAFDVNGNPLATPAVSYAITPRQMPFAGTLPSIAGSTISAGADTLGMFTLTATDAANSRTASADFAVVIPADTDGESSGASFAKLIGVMQAIDDFAPQLRTARAANNVVQMKALLTQMVTLWRTIDLDEMRDSMVISPAVGFVPSLKEMNGYGLSPTADDLLIKQVMRDAVNDLDAWTEEIRGTTTLQSLKNRADEFTTRATRINALTVSEYGTILSLGEYQLLMGHRIPAFYEALMEEVAELVGIPRRSPTFPYRKSAKVSGNGVAPQGLAAVLRGGGAPTHGKPVAKSTLAELAVTEAVGYITDKIMEEGLKSYKNSKQFAVDVMRQAAWGTGAIVLANHIREFAYGSQIYEVVSGASLSFRYFTSPYAFIEVPSNDEPSLNDVMIIGPDITDSAIAAVTGLLGNLKDGFNVGKDAATNPKHFKNQDAAQKLKKKLDASVKDIQKGAQDLFDVTASMHQEVQDAEKGCIFDSDPNCVQLRFDDGFKSVYTYSPPPGFVCFSGLPLPIPFIVQDQLTGLMYFGTPAFLPTPKVPPPPGNC